MPGDVYDTLVLTEDNEITLAIKTLGGLVTSPTLFPELCYALFLDIVYLKGILDMSTGRQADWQHVVQTPTAQGVGA